MRLNRFYFENLNDDKKIEFGKGPILHQIKNVLKMKEKEMISLFSQTQESLYIIERIDNKKVLLSWKENLSPQVKLKREVILFQSLIKKDKMEWVTQKAVELGVKKLIPVISERSEKKDINLERLQKIIIEATEQCGRIDIMEIEAPVKFKDALKQKSPIAFLGDGSGKDFSNLIKESLDSKAVFSVFVGPEGGFSPVEMTLALENGLKIGALSNYTLRSETAAVATLSLLFNI